MKISKAHFSSEKAGLTAQVKHGEEEQCHNPGRVTVRIENQRKTVVISKLHPSLWSAGALLQSACAEVHTEAGQWGPQCHVTQAGFEHSPSESHADAPELEPEAGSGRGVYGKKGSWIADTCLLLHGMSADEYIANTSRKARALASYRETLMATRTPAKGLYITGCNNQSGNVEPGQGKEPRIH